MTGDDVVTYGEFAGVYDRLMDDFNYTEWADYYIKLIGGLPKTLCDVGCGTGSMSIEMAKRGARVTGIDLSSDMLEIAAIKARADAQKISFVRQDMRYINLPRQVDSIICACDGVNYLTSLDDVELFMIAAYKSLKVGGVLAFDISSKYKLETLIGDGFFGEEREDIAYLWQNSYDKERLIVTMELSFYVRRDNGMYERFHETHVQRAHDSVEITYLLAKSGFTDIRVYGDMTFDSPAWDERRIHFSARRQ